MNYGVLYLGTDLQACFGETLARLRPSVSLIAVVQEEWSERGFMPVGTIPAAWRHGKFNRSMQRWPHCSDPGRSPSGVDVVASC